ncbi:MAG TPA: TonB-dependent receptor [Patescibacteria group bacterium]|nr:TonB-dependent receptor [Patescibacteria group bacterium]
MATLLATPAFAADGAYQVPEVVVIGVTPLLGSGVDIDKVPSNVQVIHPSQVQDQAPGSALDMLNDRLGSVSTSDYQGNPLQPNLSFRGFNASPVLGDPQGIAVYQNGMRLNEAFGDLVNWDMNPSFAIDSLQVLPGSNPAFGLNALGGAVAMKMKDGFSFQGDSVELGGGSFGRARTTVESGRQWGDNAFYTGMSAQNDDGWRDSSPSKLIQGYTDVSVRRGPLDLGLGLTLGASDLSGLGTTPKDLLDQRDQAIFTAPDKQQNALVAMDLRGAYQYSESLSLQGNLYFRHLVEATHNGDGSGLSNANCGAGAGICDDNGNQVLDRGGNPLTGSATGLINNTTTHTDSVGAGEQISRDAPVFGHANTFNAGLSTDQGWTWYGVNSEIGNLDPNSRTVTGGGDYLGGSAYNVALNARSGNYGAYVTDTYSLTDQLHATLSGRYNIATIQLQDQLGTGLDGDHAFQRFNPAAGLTWQAIPGLTTYANYSEANRAPTAAELSCANPEEACRVPNAFQSDPSLLQVVSRTVEVGARGSRSLAGADSESKDKVGWSLAAYGNRNFNDIIFVNSGPVPGQGNFTNAGITQRTGLDAGVDTTLGRWNLSANYGYVLAVFKSNMGVVSPYNPTANAAGVIQVVPGDRMPGIPTSSLKLEAKYAVTDAWSVEGDSKISSSRYYRGDEDNAMKEIPGYAVFNASTAYTVKPGAQIFLRVQNLLDTKYATAGTLGDPTAGGVLPFSDNRFETPGESRSIWVGTRLAF